MLEKAIECTSIPTSSNYSRGLTTRLHQMLTRTLMLLEQSHHLVEAFHHDTCPVEQDSGSSDLEDYYDSESDDEPFGTHH